MSLRNRWHNWRVRAGSWVAGRSLQAHYDGASTSRLFLDWVAGLLSPNREMYGNLTVLRARARELVRNNGYIAGFALAVEDNLIGPGGIQLQAKIMTGGYGKDAKLNQKTNFAIENAWKEWGHAENASVDCVDSWIDQQRLIARGVFIDGEAILRKRAGADNEFGYANELIDPDLLDDTLDRPADANGVEISLGIEMNRAGKPLAYHFWPAHPSEIFRKGLPRTRVRVPADEIIHLFLRKRVGQSRGVTELAPILTDVKMLDGYAEAELVAARFHASKMAAIEIPDPEKAAPAPPAKPGVEPANQRMNIAPGLVWRLKPGETLNTFDPTHPNAAFKEFVNTILRSVARGLGVSYLTLTGDVSAANYSSMRAGLLPEREHWRMLQFWLAESCHRRVYRAWLPQALLKGQVQTDRRIAGELLAVEWKPRGWKWVDPANDLTALEAEINLGINSRQRACAERGVDYEDVIDELQYEQEYADEQGVDVSGSAAPAPQPGRQEEPAPEKEKDENTPADEAEPEDAGTKRTRALAAV